MYNIFCSIMFHQFFWVIFFPFLCFNIFLFLTLESLLALRVPHLKKNYFKEKTKTKPEYLNRVQVTYLISNSIQHNVFRLCHLLLQLYFSL